MQIVNRRYSSADPKLNVHIPGILVHFWGKKHWFLHGSIHQPLELIIRRYKWQKCILRRKTLHFVFEIFKIHNKFAEIGRFEFGISRETADFLDFPWFAWFPFTFPLQIQRKSSKSRKSAVSEENSKLKSTYLGEFWRISKNFDIFEQEIIPSRAWNAVIIIFYLD